MPLPIIQHREPHCNGSHLASFALNVLKNGNPRDLTGGKAKCQLRNKKTGELMFTFPEEGPGALVISGSRVIFPDIDSWEVRVGIFEYDVKVTIGTKVYYFVTGDWPFVKSVTK